MIRNLRKDGDEEKQLMLLKERLQLAIKNDEFISASRRDFQQNIPAELSQEDRRTLAEQIADEDAQRVTAQGHLAEIFKTPQVLETLANLSKDQIIGLNSLWSGIKTELKGVNLKTFTPKDFISFLNRYMETAVSLQGALNVAINSVEELKKVIPSRETVEQVVNFIQSKPKTPSNSILLLKLRGDRTDLGLINVLPTEALYNTIDSLPAVQKKASIDKLLDAGYPNEILLKKAVDDEKIEKIEKLLQGINDKELTLMNAALRQIDALGGVPLPPSSTPRGTAISTSLGTTLVTPTLKAKEPEIASFLSQLEDYTTDRNLALFETFETKREISKYAKNPAGSPPLSDDARRDYKALIAQNSRDVRTYVADSYKAGKIDNAQRQRIIDIINSRGFDKPDPKPETWRFVGRGIKLGRGRPPSNKPKVPYKLKIAEGIKTYKEPVNREFGKYIINTNQLKKQIFHVKQASGGQLSWFKPTAISDSFTELLNDMLETKTLNKHLLKSLDKDEQKLFYDVADRAGLLRLFKLEKPVDTAEKDMEKTFQILLGEYQAGNNSPLMIKELRKHIIYFTNRGKIPKQKALAMLTELG